VDEAVQSVLVGMFFTVATVMWLTRRVNWYALHE
jgi:inner membrane protein involved in colicin E2 resistance